jgi:hypothetical protein
MFYEYWTWEVVLFDYLGRVAEGVWYDIGYEDEAKAKADVLLAEYTRQALMAGEPQDKARRVLWPIIE